MNSNMNLKKSAEVKISVELGIWVLKAKFGSSRIVSISCEMHFKMVPKILTMHECLI